MGVLFIFSCFATALGRRSFYIEEALLSFLISEGALLLLEIAGDGTGSELSMTGFDEGPSDLIESPLFGTELGFYC